MFFSYDGVNKTFLFHETADEAKQQAEKTIEKDSDIEYGWKEDEGSIDTCWGIVAERCSRDKNRELTLAPNDSAKGPA